MLLSAEDKREMGDVKPLLVSGYAVLCLRRNIPATMPYLVS